jgi:hypothetical protein
VASAAIAQATDLEAVADESLTEADRVDHFMRRVTSIAARSEELNKVAAQYNEELTAYSTRLRELMTLL